MPVEIDLERARRLTQEVVAARGHDFVYNKDGVGQCSYIPLPDDPDPGKRETGCIVGEVLKLAGVDPRELTLTGTVVHTCQGRQHLVHLTREATTYLQIAQTVQDRGGTWGIARSAAEAYVSVLLGTYTFPIEEASVETA